MTEPQRRRLKQHASELQRLGNRIAGAARREASQVEEGFVYVIANQAWPDALKIGQAVDVESRLAQYQTYDPLRSYRLLSSVYTLHRSALEQAVHSRLAQYRTNGEWFLVSPSQARAVLREEAELLNQPRSKT